LGGWKVEQVEQLSDLMLSPLGTQQGLILAVKDKDLKIILSTKTPEEAGGWLEAINQACSAAKSIRGKIDSTHFIVFLNLPFVARTDYSDLTEVISKILKQQLDVLKEEIMKEVMDEVRKMMKAPSRSSSDLELHTEQMVAKKLNYAGNFRRHLDVLYKEQQNKEL
jgi:hypothetical protein